MTLKNGFSKCPRFAASTSKTIARFPAKYVPYMERGLFDWLIRIVEIKWHQREELLLSSQSVRFALRVR